MIANGFQVSKGHNNLKQYSAVGAELPMSAELPGGNLRMPDNPQKIVCIGDVHGYCDRLKSLLAHLRAKLSDFEDHLVVFLGDYVDRGPDSRQTLDFLIECRVQLKNAVFLAGNHEYALMGFLGILPDDRPSYADTWSDESVFFRGAFEKQLLYTGPGYETMHLQGRRYRLYSPQNTFASYGVPYMDRDALLTAMPQSHKDFLRGLSWVHEIPGYVFVHAGLEDTGVSPCHMGLAEQLQLLRDRSCIFRVEPLSGREGVLHNVPDLIAGRTCLVSGHHASVHFGPYRVVMDESGGKDDCRLAAVILPSALIVYHTGDSEQVDSKRIFPD